MTEDRAVEASRWRGGRSQRELPAAAPAGDKLETLLNVDVLQIELGFGLVALADARKGGDLLDRVTGGPKDFCAGNGSHHPADTTAG